MANRIATLDGWRAIAILLVVAHHAGTAFYPEADYWSSSPTRFGVFGVDIFFALSGLLITTLLPEERRKTGTISLAGFYVRRSFRILPPCLAYLAVISAAGLIATKWEIASSLLFFRNYLPAHLGGVFTTHLWSLGVEEHFYLIWPALLLVARAHQARYAALVALACALWRTLESRLHLLAALLPDVTPGRRTDFRFDALLWGAAAAFLLHDPLTREWLRRRLSFPIWLAALSACAYCVVKPPFMAPTWTAFLMPLLLAGTVLHPAWAVSRCLDVAQLRWIGRISYSLYLWQELFLVPSWERAITPWTLWQNMAAAFLTAVASYYLLERPMIRLGHSFGRWRIMLASGRLSLPDRRLGFSRRS